TVQLAQGESVSEVFPLSQLSGLIVLDWIANHPGGYVARRYDRARPRCRRRLNTDPLSTPES
ncbi:MAG TPA: hypothetical protein VGH66_05010, partial [Acidimicrobiales bacterium]